MCEHQPPCPNADASDHESARVVSCHPEQGWSLLCNGVIVFEDTGELLPDGTCVQPHRGLAPHNSTASHPALMACTVASGVEYRALIAFISRSSVTTMPL